MTSVPRSPGASPVGGVGGDGPIRRVTRRSLMGLAGGGAAAVIVAGASRPLAAFTVKEAPKDIDDAYQSACRDARDYNAEIRAAVVESARGDGLDRADIDAIVAAYTCPLCGCSVTDAG